MSRSRVIGLVAAGVVLTLVAGFAVVYFFGTPTTVTVQATPAQGQVAEASEDGAPMGGAPVPADAKAPEADPNSPLAIQIPGCTCHSDDPKVVEEHAQYRMNQCSGCHNGETPTGQ